MQGHWAVFRTGSLLDNGAGKLGDIMAMTRDDPIVADRSMMFNSDLTVALEFDNMPGCFRTQRSARLSDGTLATAIHEVPIFHRRSGCIRLGRPSGGNEGTRYRKRPVGVSTRDSDERTTGVATQTPTCWTLIRLV